MTLRYCAPIWVSEAEKVAEYDRLIHGMKRLGHIPRIVRILPVMSLLLISLAMLQHDSSASSGAIAQRAAAQSSNEITNVQVTTLSESNVLVTADYVYDGSLGPRAFISALPSGVTERGRGIVQWSTNRPACISGTSQGTVEIEILFQGPSPASSDTIVVGMHRVGDNMSRISVRHEFAKEWRAESNQYLRPFDERWPDC
jgi:hypothetical protein